MAGTLEALAEGCAQVQPLWAQLRLRDRARYLRRAGQAVIDELDELLTLLSGGLDREPAEVAALELLPAVDGLQWLAADGTRALRDRRLGAPRGSHPLKQGRASWEPLGVVGILGAPEAPFAQPLWQGGAALLAGNGVVLVPHPRGELGAERIARLFVRAGLPEGLLAIAPAGAALVPDGLAKAVVPGGEAGRAAAAACAEAGVPVALDAGGGGAGVVLPDASTAHAARGAANAAFAAGGRARGSAKRAWVARGLHDAWVARVVALAEGGRAVAVPERAVDLVADAVGAGARLRCGGPQGGGAFAPAALTGVTDDMEIARVGAEAPVLAVGAVGSTDLAIAGANATRLRGGVSVWSADRYEGERIAHELVAAPVWLNDHPLGVALPAVPLGPGLGGEEGLRAYTSPDPVTWDPPS